MSEMGSQQLFIPDKIRVGAQTRNDTYTKRLAYVIYYDKAGVLRKEKSWETWRDKKIDPADYDNVPTEGFVLNRPGGGTRNSYSHNVRSEFVRVYDPRDFEFEISIPNLLFILRECDCSRGKGLEGKFVYAWDKTELVLLPVGCEEYRASKGFTELQGSSVKAKELVPGAVYMTKYQKTWTFIGRLDYFFAVNVNRSHEAERKVDAKGVVKQYVFHNGEHFVYEDKPKSISVRVGDGIADNYLALAAEYLNSIRGSRVVELLLEEKTDKDLFWAFQELGGIHYQYSTGKDYDGSRFIESHGAYWLKDGILYYRHDHDRVYDAMSKEKNRNWYRGGIANWIEPTQWRLSARLASGVVVPINYNFRR